MQLQSYFNPATGVLIWCVLVLLFGLGFSIGLARWYNTWYAEEKQKAKEKDEAQKEDPTSNPVISEVEKLATAACPFAGKCLKKISKDGTRIQQKCPVSGYYEQLPIEEENGVEFRPVPPPHPKDKNKDKNK